MCRHIKEMHNKIKEFKCDECGKEFNRRNALNKHIRNIHNKAKSSNDSEHSTTGVANALLNLPASSFANELSSSRASSSNEPLENLSDDSDNKANENLKRTIEDVDYDSNDEDPIPPAKRKK